MCESSNNSTLPKIPEDVWISGETFLTGDTENFVGMTHASNKFVQFRRLVEGGTDFLQEGSELQIIKVAKIILCNGFRKSLTRRITYQERSLVAKSRMMRTNNLEESSISITSILQQGSMLKGAVLEHLTVA